MTADRVNKLFLLRNLQMVPEKNPAPYVMQIGLRLLGVMQQWGEDDHSPSSSAQVMNVWVCASTPLYDFMPCTDTNSPVVSIWTKNF